MKLSLILSILLLFAGGVSAGKAEKKLERMFYEAESNISEDTDAATYRWLASGYLYGSVHTVDNSGWNYVVEIKKDERKAFRFFEKASSLNDPQSAGIIGILYRKGIGVEKNLLQSVSYLSLVKDSYPTAAGEYGIAMHERFKHGELDSDDKASASQMINSLRFAASHDYIPSLNALHQILSEGKYWKKDKQEAEYFLLKSQAISKKILEENRVLAEAIADARERFKPYEGTWISRDYYNDESRNQFWKTIGIIATASYILTLPPVSPSGPSYFDLQMWGMVP